MNCVNLRLIGRFLSAAVLLFIYQVLLPKASAAIVTIEQDITIDESNSYPDPGFGVESLLVEIIDGPTVPTRVHLADGGVIGGAVHVLGNSHLLITGGRVEARTVVSEYATLTIAGGSIQCTAAQCATDDTAYVLNVEENGTINIRGGEIGTNTLLEDSAVANIFARSFSVDGELPSASVNPSGVRIQGTYADGHPFDLTIIRDIATALVFIHTVPEPTNVTLGYGLLLAISWVWRPLTH